MKRENTKDRKRNSISFWSRPTPR